MKQSLKQRASDALNCLPALFLALKDKRTPRAARAVALIAVAGALSPVDIIPDFIPVLGYLDDLLLLPVLIAWAIKLIPPELWQQKLLQARGLWQNGKPKRWYYALPVILVWLLLAWLIIKLLFF